MAFQSQARAQFQRFTQTGEVPTTGQPGSFAVNIADQKIWTFDSVGAPVRVTRTITMHDPNLAYGQDDIVITGDTLWQALADIPPKPFTATDWLRLGATSTEVSSNPTASGVYNGGVISLLGGNSVGVTAGSGVIVDATFPANPTRTEVSWAGLSGAVLANGSLVRAITISTAGSLGSVDVADIPSAGRTRIILGIVYYDDAGNITALQNLPRIPGQTAKDFPDLVSALGGPFRVNGGTISAGGGLKIDISQSTLFGVGLRWRNTPAEPNFAQFPPGTDIPFDVIYANGDVLAAAATDVPADVYESGPIPAGFATIHYLFTAPGVKTWLQIGQTVYPNITQALLSLDADWAAFDTQFTRDSQTIFLGAVAVVRGATDLTAADQGAVVPVSPGPRASQRFQLQTASIEFLRLDGTSAMEGPLDMNGNPVQNATIDEGVF